MFYLILAVFLACVLNHSLFFHGHEHCIDNVRVLWYCSPCLSLCEKSLFLLQNAFSSLWNRLVQVVFLRNQVLLRQINNRQIRKQVSSESEMNGYLGFIIKHYRKTLHRKINFSQETSALPLAWLGAYFS